MLGTLLISVNFIMGSGSEMIKMAFMVKRSQMKGAIKVENFMCRWFVLTNKVLRYHEGAPEVSGSYRCLCSLLSSYYLVCNLRMRSTDL
ncbi:hypothetical protein LSAT2_032082, partial [Lamellibrachia satsuma]